MKTIQYAGGELTTGDEIADAIILYSAALAQTGAADSIEIPTATTDGSTETAVLLLGPASQIVARPAERGMAEIVDEALVRVIRSRAEEQLPTAGQTSLPLNSSSFSDIDDL